MNDFNTNTNGTQGTGINLGSIGAKAGAMGADTIRIAITAASAIACLLFFAPAMSIGAYGIALDLSLFNVAFGVDIMGYHVDGNLLGLLWLLLPLAGGGLAWAGDVRSAGKRAIAPLAIAALLFVVEVTSSEYAAYMQVAATGWLYVVACLAGVGISVWSIVNERSGAAAPAYAAPAYRPAVSTVPATQTTASGIVASPVAPRPAHVAPAAPAAPTVPAQAVRFCRNCGAKLDDGAVFCRNCGTKIA